MKKQELKIVLKAAARIAREHEFVIIGSQAIHAQCRRPPAEVLLSQECDLYPRTHPEAATLLDRELGRNSAFARKHGFYVDVVSPEIATLPEGWERRVKSLRVGQITAFCLEIHDLLASKLAAGREGSRTGWSCSQAAYRQRSGFADANCQAASGLIS